MLQEFIGSYQVSDSCGFRLSQSPDILHSSTKCLLTQDQGMLMQIRAMAVIPESLSFLDLQMDVPAKYIKFRLTSRPDIILLATILIVTACGNASVNKRIAVSDKELKKSITGTPSYLHDLVKSKLEEGDRNEVLNWNRMGLRSFRYGDLKLSAKYFDLSIKNISKIFSNDTRAQKARSLWFSEDTKIYKGHPYERAMVFLYRGINYYLNDDLENARAMFKSGQLQDAFAEEGQHKSDYALFDYLDGRITQKLESSENAKPLFSRMNKLRLMIPVPSRVDNLLIVSAVNVGPVKYSNTNHPDINERIRIRISKGTEPIKTVIAFHENKLMGKFSKIEDLNYQASTRGGREFDSIVKGKVIFKTATRKFGDTALSAGAHITARATHFRDSKDRAVGTLVGIGVMAVGGVLKVISEKTNTSVDVRTWRSLPGQFHILSHRMTPGTHTLQIRYYKTNMVEIKNFRQNVNVTIRPEKKDNLHFVRPPEWARKKREEIEKQKRLQEVGKLKKTLLATKICPECDLRAVNLNTLDLKNADLNASNLSGAELNGANLSGADLRSANLMGAFLSNAKLIGANLRGANLRGANLKNANLIGANLIGVNLTGAKLDGAKMEGAILPKKWVIEQKRLAELKRKEHQRRKEQLRVVEEQKRKEERRAEEQRKEEQMNLFEPLTILEKLGDWLKGKAGTLM